MNWNDFANGLAGASAAQDKIDKAKELKATSEAKLIQDNLDNEWKQKERNFKEQDWKDKLAKAETDRKAEGNKNLKTDTYQSLDHLFETGDPIRLNAILDKYKDNPNMESKFAHIARFDRINEEDLEKGNLANYLKSEKNNDAALEEQLDTNGDGVVDKQDLDGLRKRFVKRITKDGKVEIIDTHILAGANGYFKNWNPDKNPKNATKSKDEWRLDEFKSLQAKLKNAKTPEAKQEVQEQIDFLNGGKDGGSKPTTNQVKAVELANAKKTVEVLKDKKDLSTEETRDLDIANERIRLGMTAEGKNNLAEQTAAVDLDKIFKDVPAEEVRKRIDTDKELKVKFGRLTGFSVQEEKELLEIIPQIQAMKQAAKIGKKETGIVDATLRDVENQLTGLGHNDVKSEMTASAYKGLMTVIKHIFYGSAQTPGEMKSYKSAYGSLDQGLVHALGGLRSIIDDRIQKLKYIASRKNDTMAKYYTGQSSAELDEVLATLDNKLSYLAEFAEYGDTFATAQSRDLVDKARGAIGSAVGLVWTKGDSFISGKTDDDVKAARAKLKQAYSDSDFQAKLLQLQKKYGLDENVNEVDKKPANPLDVEL